MGIYLNYIVETKKDGYWFFEEEVCMGKEHELRWILQDCADKDGELADKSDASYYAPWPNDISPKSAHRFMWTGHNCKIGYTESDLFELVYQELVRKVQNDPESYGYDEDGVDYLRNLYANTESRILWWAE